MHNSSPKLNIPEQIMSKLIFVIQNSLSVTGRIIIDKIFWGPHLTPKKKTVMSK